MLLSCVHYSVYKDPVFFVHYVRRSFTHFLIDVQGVKVNDHGNDAVTLAMSNSEECFLCN